MIAHKASVTGKRPKQKQKKKHYGSVKNTDACVKNPRVSVVWFRFHSEPVSLARDMIPLLASEHSRLDPSNCWKNQLRRGNPYLRALLPRLL